MHKIPKSLNNFVSMVVNNNRKRFDIESAERFVIEKTGGYNTYAQLGGYSSFFDAVKLLEKHGVIAPIQSSGFNGLNPVLKSRWRIVREAHVDEWDIAFMMQLSDKLDMSGYIKNPKWHTQKEKQLILSIYKFLKTADKREWASCEERCLELFGNEKFLLTEDRKVLSRLNLTYERLKMKKYGHMFTYWIGKRDKIRRVIILENHSTFFSMKRWVERGGTVFGITPDLIIFGDGKHIIKSFSFLNEIADAKKCIIDYFGDVDPEGWQIYYTLKKNYSGYNINLFFPAYKFLLDAKESFPIGDSKQNMNPNVLDFIINEFKQIYTQYVDKILCLWNEKNRIPQEFLTYEVLKDMEF
jgi:hypothetical protein